MRQQSEHRRPLWRRVLIGLAWGVGGLLLLLVAAVSVGTWWLTPDRLTRIVNDEASEQLNADVRASNVRFTLWSTFPHLNLELDSLNVRSRNFDTIPVGLRAELPAHADFLASTGAARGGINILKLLRGQIWLKDVMVDSLRLNMVVLTDSLNNYDITRSNGSTKVPYFVVEGLEIGDGGQLSYRSIPSGSLATVALDKVSLTPSGAKNAYRLALGGRVTASSDNLVILNNFPFGLDGDVKLRFKPFGVQTTDYRVSLGRIDGNMSLDVNLGDSKSLSRFNYTLDGFTLNDLYSMLPPGSVPMVKDLSADIDIDCSARLTTPYNFASAYLPSVNVDFSVPRGRVEYTLGDNRRYSIDEISLRGTFVFDGRDPSKSYLEVPRIAAGGNGAKLTASGRVDHLTGAPEVNARFECDVNLAAAARVMKELQPYSPKGDLDVKGDIKCVVVDNSLLLSEMQATVNARGAEAGNAETRIRIDDATARFSATRRAKPLKISDFRMPGIWNVDTRSLGFAKHTPQFVTATIGNTLRTLLANWNPRLDLNVRRASMSIKGYENPTTLTKLSMTATTDSVVLRKAHISSGKTNADLSGRVRDLREFLMSRTPAPLRVDLNLDADMLQINQLARAYAAVHPDIRMKADEAEVQGYTVNRKVDTVAYIIPRNLYANVHASANQVRYTNLHLSDLSADLKTADGIATLDTLHIGSDFGEADLHLCYATQNLQDIRVGLGLCVCDLNVVNFFKNFPALLKMWPQMSNLSGIINANIDGGVRVFPTMNVMMPSLHAIADITGRHLQVHQDEFIRHLTKMLLLSGNEDLKIENMDIHAVAHSNLLEVFPFIFEVERYKLQLSGLNNFGGDLFYHIGVEDWPLKLPFGVNVKGTYEHPVIKFGGRDWHPQYGTNITRGVQDYSRVNIIEESMKYTREMVRHAATYEGE